MPFGFQGGVSVLQALLQAQSHVTQGLQPVAILYLSKDYDKFDRKELMHALGNWVQVNTLHMIRAVLGPLQVHKKGDPTDFNGSLIRGVRQGAPSSPIYFNVYIDELSKEVERRERRWENRRGKVSLLGGVVLVQAETMNGLHHILGIEAWWSGRADAEWSVDNCAYLQLPNGEVNGKVYLYRCELKDSREEKILGNSLLAGGVRIISIRRESMERRGRDGLTTSMLLEVTRPTPEAGQTAI